MNEYIVLSRKYRPKKLSELIGQNFVYTALTNAFLKEKIAHAFILTGIRGTGKTTVARIIAMGLNCKKEEKPTSEPCGKCKNCQEILEDRYEEVLEIDAASHTSVDDVREIISYIKYRPTKGLYKVFIIDEVHMLSNAAFNALLKTIEEPPEYVKFIFCTTEQKKIPITILSRCQRYELNRVNRKEISSFLMDIAIKEKVKLTKEAANIIARYSEGSVRDSLSILDQAIITNQGLEVDIEDINKTLGLTGNKVTLNLFHNMAKGDIEEAFKNLSQAYKLGANPAIMIDDLLQLNYHLILSLSLKEYKEIYEVYNEEVISQILDKLNVSFLNQAWQMLLRGKSEMAKTPLKTEALEVLILRIIYMAKLPTIESIVASINKEDNNMHNKEIGNDIKKILNIFPGSEIIKD